MAEEWHYAHDGKQFGPVPSEELRRLASSGQLQPSDLIWKNGMADWAPASKVKGLFPQAASTLIPVPPPLQQAIVRNPAPPPIEQVVTQNLAPSPHETGATHEALLGSMSERVKEGERPGTSKAMPTQTADAMSDLPEVKTQEPQGETSPKSGEIIGGGILGGLLVSLCLSVCQRLIYGDWMSLWPFVTSSLVIGGAFAAIGRQKLPSEDDKQLQTGFFLGMAFGVVYGLYFGGSVSNAFYGSCVGLTVAGLASWFHVPFTVGRTAGAVAISFVMLHYLGFIGTTLSPNGSHAVVSQAPPRQSATSDYGKTELEKATSDDLKQFSNREAMMRAYGPPTCFRRSTIRPNQFLISWRRIGPSGDEEFLTSVCVEPLRADGTPMLHIFDHVITSEYRLQATIDTLDQP